MAVRAGGNGLCEITATNMKSSGTEVVMVVLEPTKSGAVGKCQSCLVMVNDG